MKKVVLSLLLALIAFSFSFGQSKDEQKIRQLEVTWSEALVKFDTITLRKIWSPEYVINNPAGKVVTGKEIIQAMKSGTRYQAYEKTIERITIIDNIAIVMGKEVLIDQPKDPKQSTARRITNIWIKKKGNWYLIARQATNI